MRESYRARANSAVKCFAMAKRIRRAIFSCAAAAGFAFACAASSAAGDLVYKKIPCPDDGCDMEKIRPFVAEIVTQGPDYLLVQIEKGESVPGYSLVAPKESDFILRLVWIEVDSQDDVDFLASLGIDIWQVGKNHVYGRADDSQVDKIRDAGLELEFVPQP